MPNPSLCRQSPELAESIIRSLPIGIITFDHNLRILAANPRAAKLIRLGRYMDKSLQKGTNNPGSPGIDWTALLKAAVSAGKTHKLDGISCTVNGKTRLLQIACAPLARQYPDKTDTGAVILEDITEKLNIQRQLADAERLATVGKLASRVAHELNNPLDGILRYINLTLRIIENENLEKPKEYLNQCRGALMRMVHILGDLLEFSRRTSTPFGYAGIDHIVEDALKTMTSALESSNVTVRRNYAPDMPQIKTGNLFQVFVNLIKNAIDAMPDGGIIQISMRQASPDMLAVELRDTGTGFAPENADAIFEPFFTTKERGRGSGLGLAISRDIVERLNGRIVAQNAPEGGSILTILLPLADARS
ncbi:MAG: two-component system sensor histidine kinase NtrB [Planctomycetota bacterium]